MAWHQGLEPSLRRTEPLAVRTTFRIGGSAAFFLEPTDERAFADAYAAAVRSGMPVHILGGGSNLLISDSGVQGIVLSTARLRGRIRTASRRRARVPAGMSLRKLVRWTARHRLAGLEGLVGIPGTVGGAVYMNAGGRHGAIGSRVGAVWCVGRDGETFVRGGRDVRWEYRSTNIREPILAVELLLDRDRPAAIRERMDATLAQKRESQPVAEPSAGCFFKNPPGESAGSLIERSGMKGQRVGMARVSTRHANFIVNMGGATAGDVLALRGKVRDRVRERFGLRLEDEVCHWPEAPA